MARNVIPTAISYYCDCCNCSCGSAPAISMSGMRNGSDLDMSLRQPFSLDLCAECMVDFDNWIAAQKSAHQNQ